MQATPVLSMVFLEPPEMISKYHWVWPNKKVGGEFKREHLDRKKRKSQLSLGGHAKD